MENLYNKKNFKTPIITGILFVLTGFLLWFLSTIINNLEIKHFLEFFSHGIICVGFISVIIDIPDWRKYFGERVKDIVLNHSYLDTLEYSKLEMLQILILQSKYKNSEIIRDGSFLEYMKNRIEQHVNSSYRENVDSFLVISETEYGDLLYKESISYRLRAMGENIINIIEWTWAEDEINEAILFKINVKCPFNKFSQKDKCKCSNRKDCINGNVEINPEMNSFQNNEIGFKVDLNEFIEVSDGTIVSLELTYRMGQNRLYFWSMVVPSKDLNVKIVYPSGYKVDSFVGGLSKTEYIEINDFNNHFYSFKRDGWMLPRAGLAIGFVKK